MRVAFFALALTLCGSAKAEWLQDVTGLAWQQDGKTVWKLVLDPAKGKPHFHPLTVAGGPSLVIASPADHPWHYGLWFSWKYINHANYWEENRETGKAQGRTTWKIVKIKTHRDGGAMVKLKLTYTNPNGHVDLEEIRVLDISAPLQDGSYTIDWNMAFTAGPDGALLDRTPMPGEPDGRVNGGYAGIAVRLLPPPYDVQFATAQDGPLTKFDENRARPESKAVIASFSESGKPVGAIAIIPLTMPSNSRARVPWYVVDASATETQMRFFNQSLLAPASWTLKPGEKFGLVYQARLAPVISGESIVLGQPNVRLSIH